MRQPRLSRPTPPRLALKQWCRRAPYLKLLLALALPAYLISCSPEGTNSRPLAALSQTTNQRLLPLINSFAQSAKTLDEAVLRFCHNPSNPGELYATQKAWLAAQTSWSKAKIALACAETDSRQSMRQHLQAARFSKKKLQQTHSLLFGVNPVAKFTAPSTSPSRCAKLATRSNALSLHAGRLWRHWAQAQGNYAGQFLSLGVKGLVLIKTALTQNLKNLANANRKGERWAENARDEIQANRSIFGTSLASLSSEKHLRQQIYSQYEQVDQQLDTLSRLLKQPSDPLDAENIRVMHIAVEASVRNLIGLLNHAPPNT